jgi:chromosome segregation protein
MRLEKIKLSGFKSFVDPTTVHFPGNMQGVVGPNGCGKSNIIDAVRWVMGESSAKHLRGDSMADVIFNGSTSRKPVGHASIELVFDNSDGTIAGEYASYNQISVRRQVSRDGQSNFYLNGSRCRRRDITGIFLGTGLGPRSYSIIEQGMISRLIEAKPEELRVFLEEAAGISKYKERRKETENRIRHTRDNLDRINDLREEIDKQLAHLQRQAKTAEKYKILKQEERQGKAELLALRLRANDVEASSKQKLIQERETALEGARAQQRAIEASLEKERDTHIEATDEFNEVQGRYYGLGGDIARVEQGIQHAKDMRQKQELDLKQVNDGWNEVHQHIDLDEKLIVELQQKLEASGPELEQSRSAERASREALDIADQQMRDWQQSWDEFSPRASTMSGQVQVERTRIDHLQRQIGQYQQRFERLQEEQRVLGEQTMDDNITALEQQAQGKLEQEQNLQQQLEELLGQISTLREENTQQRSELDQTRSQSQDTRGRLVSLEALQKAALGKVGGKVTNWLEGHGLNEAKRLAQELKVDAGWERAVETVLGNNLEAVCVDGIDSVAGVLDTLQDGALTLFDTQHASTSFSASDIATPLLAHVQAPWALDSLMAGVYCADSLNDALAMRSRLGAQESVITPEGIWLGSSWLRVARDIDEKGGVLEREQGIKDLSAELQQLEKSVARLQQELEQGRSALQTLEQQRDGLQQQVNVAHREYSELKAQLQSKRTQQEQHQVRQQKLAHEITEVQEHLRHDNDEHEQSRARLSAAEASLAELEQERNRLTEQRDTLRQALDEQRHRAHRDREQAHEIALRSESMRSQLGSTQQNLERMQSQLNSLKQRQDELQQLLDAGVEPLTEMGQELATLLENRVGVENELGNARKKLESLDEAMRQHERDRTAAEEKVQEVRTLLEQARMEWQEFDVRHRALQEQLDETGFQLSELLEQLAEEANVPEWQANVDKLGQRIQRLGAINLAAIDEFAEQTERKQYLDEQYKDVTEALETLENAIRKIDRETRTRFKETYDKVNGQFKEMFPRMFGGGHAYLELTGDDLLEAGVSVMARPPGKRNSSIHLLSGGEKALTAVSLVFAIFHLNPSPFCMLDEVDAPLDDANVGRFCEMVKEMSKSVQFIFITHNKITMSMAEHLAGVTMHEPGVSRLVSVDVEEAAKLAAI